MLRKYTGEEVCNFIAAVLVIFIRIRKGLHDFDAVMQLNNGTPGVPCKKEDRRGGLGRPRQRQLLIVWLRI